MDNTIISNQYLVKIEDEVEDDADDTPFYEEISKPIKPSKPSKPNKLTKNKIIKLRKQLKELSRKLDEILELHIEQPYKKRK